MFEGVQNHVLDLLRKASLVHFISFRNLWSRVKRQVWSTFKLFEKASLLHIRRKIWTKLAFSKQVQHVILNSFKHFSGPKYKTLGIYFGDIFWMSVMREMMLLAEIARSVTNILYLSSRYFLLTSVSDHKSTRTNVLKAF